MDIPATSIDAAGAVYPDEFNGNNIKPIEGESFLNLLSNKLVQRKANVLGARRESRYKNR